MAGPAAGKTDRLATAYFDGFLLFAKWLPTIRRQIFIFIVRICLFNKYVLNIRRRICQPPGKLIAAPEQNKGRARCGCTNQILLPFRTLDFQMCQIPNRWRGQRQMRIIGQNRLAAFRSVACQNPIVRSAHFFILAHRDKIRLGRLGAFRAGQWPRIQAEQRRQIGKRWWIVRRQCRQQIVDFIGRQSQSRKGKTLHFGRGI